MIENQIYKHNEKNYIPNLNFSEPFHDKNQSFGEYFEWKKEKFSLHQACQNVIFCYFQEFERYPRNG